MRTSVPASYARRTPLEVSKNCRSWARACRYMRSMLAGEPRRDWAEPSAMAEQSASAQSRMALCIGSDRPDGVRQAVCGEGATNIMAPPAPINPAPAGAEKRGCPPPYPLLSSAAVPNFSDTRVRVRNLIRRAWLVAVLLPLLAAP